MQRTRVGNVDVIALVDAVRAYPAPNVYPKAGDAISRFSSYLGAGGELAMNFGCFVVRDGSTTVLVDCGLGPEAQGQLVNELCAAGVSHDSINLVAFTHLHGDHTGWNLDRATGQPLFPRARYLVPRGDWDHYSSQDPQPASFKRDVAPLAPLGTLELIDGERVLSQAITAHPSPGHTPGHTSYLIVSGAARGCILGDVVISPIDTAEPGWPNTFDWNADIARATRVRMLDRLATEGATVGGSHLPSPGLGRFIKAGASHSWEPLAP